MADLPSVTIAAGLDVGLVCDDGVGMRRFYGDVLGFAETLAFPIGPGVELVMFDYGASTLKLQLVEEPPSKSAGGIEAACGYRLLTISVPSIAEVSRRAEAAGLRGMVGLSLDELGFPGSDDPGGEHVRIAFTQDPDGNLIELVQGLAPPGVHAIGLTVADAEASRRFWVDIVGGTDLGETRITGSLTKRDVEFKGTIVKFWQLDLKPPTMTGPIRDHVGIRYVTATVSDAPAAYAALVADGAMPDTEPTELLPGITIGFVRDPDGNQLELVGA